ncbi:MAG TPA: hypothetical protein VG756_02190 [Pseudonocardiaceae bacterium]|nr:hypothetical protein [Pseudonocardiaceae bacterium]
MNEPTPDEAAAALRAVQESREQVISSSPGPWWTSIVCGLVVFAYCAAVDLFPAAGTWLNVAALAFCLVLVFGRPTRVGGTLLGQRVMVSGRSLPLSLTSRLLRIAPVVVIGIAAVLLILLLHLPHVGIYYGAAAGLFIMVLDPRFQLWLLRRQNRNSSSGRA